MLVSQWCMEWQMTLNIGKSALLRITRKNTISDFSYTLGNAQLTAVKEHKYLGLIISDDLRWEAHVNHVTSSALRRLFFLKRRLHSAPHPTKLLAYNTFVRPVLEYANIVWFPPTNNLINKLESVQRKAVRFIFNKYRTSDSPTELMQKAGMLTLQNRAKLARQKMMFQLFHNALRIDSTKYLSNPETRPSRHKHPHFLQEYRFKTNCFKFSFFPQAIREWNSLPTYITTCHNQDKFLSLLENYLRISQI